MPTYIIVLKNNQNSKRWLAMRWGSDPNEWSSDCTYNSSNNKYFPKSQNDIISPGPCPMLTDEAGNQADAFMVQLWEKPSLKKSR